MTNNDHKSKTIQAVFDYLSRSPPKRKKTKKQKQDKQKLLFRETL